MHKEKKRISVIIVTYNAGELLQECLNSIYEQSSQNINIIVIDGGSTDETVPLLKENDEKIGYWKSENDKGIYDAMNKALLQLNTEWVYFLGADDTLLPEFSTFLGELNDPTIVYYANVLYKGKKCSGEVSPYRQAKSGLFHQAIVYPSTVFLKYKYNTRYPIAADYGLNMQLHRDPDFSFQYKDYVIANYNDTGVSAIAIDTNFEADKSKMILHNFGFKIWMRYIFRRIKALISSKHR